MRAAAVVVGAVMVAALGGSAASGTGTAQPQAIGRYSTPESAVAVVRAPGLGNDYYLRTVRSLLADVPHTVQPDADYIRGGKALCTQIDDGATWQTFAEQIEETGTDYQMRRAVIGAAIISFCPQHASIIG